MDNLHELTIAPVDGKETLYLDNMRINGLTGYSIKSRLDGSASYVELVLELLIPKPGSNYQTEDRNFVIAAEVTPSATDETADNE